MYSNQWGKMDPPIVRPTYKIERLLIMSNNLKSLSMGMDLHSLTSFISLLSMCRYVEGCHKGTGCGGATLAAEKSAQLASLEGITRFLVND